jgi:hypothetical protein
MKWVTRPGIHIDRESSAWLTSRFVATRTDDRERT